VASFWRAGTPPASNQCFILGTVKLGIFHNRQPFSQTGLPVIEVEGRLSVRQSMAQFRASQTGVFDSIHATWPKRLTPWERITSVVRIKLTLCDDIISSSRISSSSSINWHCCPTTSLFHTLHCTNWRTQLVVSKVSAEWGGDGDVSNLQTRQQGRRQSGASTVHEQNQYYADDCWQSSARPSVIILQIWWLRHVTSSGQSSIHAP